MLYLDDPKKCREEQHMRKKSHKLKIRLPLRRPEPVASAPVEVEHISQEPVVASPKRQARPEAGQITIGDMIEAQKQGQSFEAMLRKPSTVEAESPVTITRKVIPYAEFGRKLWERKQKLHLQRIRERRLRKRL
jgi:hypothetical protein